jgi:hypothetical protein
MFVPAPIDSDFLPYTKRPVLKRNAGLFVDGTARRGRGARVVPQNYQCGPNDIGKACGVNNAGICCPDLTCSLTGRC